MVIPVTEEKIEVTKRPVVKEEVSLNKEEVTDTKQVSRTVKKEDVMYNVEIQAINKILKDKSLDLINKEGLEPTYFLSNKEQVDLQMKLLKEKIYQ